MPRHRVGHSHGVACEVYHQKLPRHIKVRHHCRHLGNFQVLGQVVEKLGLAVAVWIVSCVFLPEQEACNVGESQLFAEVFKLADIDIGFPAIVISVLEVVLLG